MPECQPDGTWSDIPRCIEHDPGFEPQRTKLCPGIPGYCSDSPIGQLCEFDCLIGADIRFVTNIVIGYLLTAEFYLCSVQLLFHDQQHLVEPYVHQMEPGILIQLVMVIYARHEMDVIVAQALLVVPEIEKKKVDQEEVTEEIKENKETEVIEEVKETEEIEEVVGLKQIVEAEEMEETA